MTDLAFIYHERYGGRGLAHHRLARSWERYRTTFEMAQALELPLRLFRQSPAADGFLRLVHTQAYLDWVRRMDLRAEGFLDQRDTPAYRGIFRRAALAVGGTLLGARLVADGDVAVAFNPGGGLHHAQAERTGGFCVFNDLVIATRWLMQARGVRRPVILDFDGHHGDGTQMLLYEEPILTVSLHQYDGRFYPGTGSLEEMGRGLGHGYALNVPLPRRTGTAAYLRALDELVLPVVRAYCPDFIIVQLGVDAHFADRLVSLRLSTHGYAAIAGRLLLLASEFTNGRLLVCGGGGYTPEAVARCWGVVLATLAGCPERTAGLHDDSAHVPPGRPESDAAALATLGAGQRLHFPLWGLSGLGERAA